MSFNLVQILVPLGVCVALPVLIVWLVVRAKINRDNRSSQVIIEALKNNQDIDVNTILKTFSNSLRSPREMLNRRLLRGTIFSAIGILIIIFAICLYCFADMLDEDDFSFFLFSGLIFAAVGAGFLTVFFYSRKQLLSSDNDSTR